MKKIIISTVSGEPIITHDDDDTKILDFSEKLSGIMSSSNISILETTEKVIIVRPNLIKTIEVIEIKSQENIETESLKIKEHIDIIED